MLTFSTLIGVNMNTMNMNNLAMGMQQMSFNQPIIGMTYQSKNNVQL